MNLLEQLALLVKTVQEIKDKVEVLRNLEHQRIHMQRELEAKATVESMTDDEVRTALVDKIK